MEKYFTLSKNAIFLFFLNLPPARYVIINHATTSGTSLHYITYFRNKLFETYMFPVSTVIKLTRIFISEGFIPFVSNKYMHVNYITLSLQNMFLKNEKKKWRKLKRINNLIWWLALSVDCLFSEYLRLFVLNATSCSLINPSHKVFFPWGKGIQSLYQLSCLKQVTCCLYSSTDVIFFKSLNTTSEEISKVFKDNSTWKKD